jgi:MYXO-CTERM domain-containing protein
MRTMTRGCRLAVIALLASAVAVPALASDYRFQTIHHHYAVTELRDINDAGVIVGWAHNFKSWGEPTPAFIYRDGVFKDLSPPGLFEDGSGITNSGMVVGSVVADPWTRDERRVGWLYDGSGYTLFQVPGALATHPRRVSSDGRFLTGTYYPSDRSGAAGFAYDRLSGAMVSFANSVINGANVDGIVVGFDGDRSFTYDFGSGVTTYLEIDGLEGMRLSDINDRGTMAGHYGTGLGGGAFLLFESGEFKRFPLRGGGELDYGLNNLDVLVGSYEIGNDGVVVGFVATPVPEPQAWALVLGGLALIAGVRRRKVPIAT